EDGLELDALLLGGRERLLDLLEREDAAADEDLADERRLHALTHLPWARWAGRARWARPPARSPCRLRPTLRRRLRRRLRRFHRRGSSRPERRGRVRGRPRPRPPRGGPPPGPC